MPKVLVLGAGMVVRPLVRYLLEEGHELVQADLEVSRAEAMIAGHPRGRAVALDFSDTEAVAALVRDCDLAVSLAPFQFHPGVARICIDHGKPMITASYVSPEMEALDGAARAAGVTILNEIGVDPGIDHMSAMRVIDAVRAEGGEIVSFHSYCGGLPAPEDNDNPFGYKFSWAPRGVLLASRNGARYLEDGLTVEVPGERLFRHMHLVSVPGAGDFEAYPNRDSLCYVEIYGLDGIRSMFRGTLRNTGWCDCFFNYRALGLLDLDEFDASGLTRAGLLRRLAGAAPGDDLPAALAARLGLPRHSLPIRNLEWLGLLEDSPLGEGRTTALDVLGGLLQQRLVYAPGERDMLVMLHEFRAVYPDGRQERITSHLVDFGVPGGDSSMARTVTLPVAIAAKLILSGAIRAPGVLRPITPDIYGPVLDELSDLGIDCHENRN